MLQKTLPEDILLLNYIQGTLEALICTHDTSKPHPLDISSYINRDRRLTCKLQAQTTSPSLPPPTQHSFMPFSHIPLNKLIASGLSFNHLPCPLCRASICPWPIIFSFIFPVTVSAPPPRLHTQLLSVKHASSLCIAYNNTHDVLSAPQSALFREMCSHVPFAISPVLHSNHLFPSSSSLCT